MHRVLVSTAGLSLMGPTCTTRRAQREHTAPLIRAERRLDHENAARAAAPA